MVRTHRQILIRLAVGGFALADVGDLDMVSVKLMGLPWKRRGLAPVLVSIPGILDMLIAS